MAEEIGRTGFIHSLDTFGAVDGPGIRYVVFFQGCPIRCNFCHNPDAWQFGKGTEMTAEEIVEKVEAYRPFYRDGGVTLSGGEPLAQPEFAAMLLRQLKDRKFHTAVDTAGSVPLARCREAVDLADMLLLDIKALDPDDCRKVTGWDGSGALQLLRYARETGKRVWLRHVLVPGYSLREERLKKLSGFLRDYPCVEYVELLPFHQLGAYKWQELQIPYPLENIEVPQRETLERAKAIFEADGHKVRM